MIDENEGASLFVAGTHMLLPGDSGEIPIQAAISPFDPGDFQNVSMVTAKTRQPFWGIIDTGASATCLSSRLVTLLDLATIGRCRVSTANGETEHYRHIINLVFADQMVFSGLEVTSGDIGNPDFLLGMDILRQCHLSIFPVHDQLYVDIKAFLPA